MPNHDHRKRPAMQSAIDTKTYRQNREKFSVDELRPYEGQWVAFSLDGSRVIAAADDLDALDQLVEEAGERPDEVALERIVLDATWQGALEFE